MLAAGGSSTSHRHSQFRALALVEGEAGGAAWLAESRGSQETVVPIPAMLLIPGWPWAGHAISFIFKGHLLEGLSGLQFSEG